MKKSNINDSYKLANEANKLSRSGQYEEAIELLQRAIKMNSKEAGFYSNLGNIYSRKKEYEKAIEAYLKALSIEPENHLILKNIGLSFFYLRKYQKAINYFEISLKANPDDTGAMHDIGLSFYYLNNFKKSLFWFNEVLDRKPNDFNALRNKGLVLDNMNIYNDALKYYKSALKIKSSDSATLSDIGLVFAKIGKWEKAIENYNMAIESDPNNLNAFFNKGIALKSKEKIKEALKCFDKAIELNPEFDEAYIYKGILLKLIKSGKSKINHYVIKHIDSCYIAFFDILGFKDLVNNNSHEYLKKLYFNNFEFSISASLNDVKVSIIGPIEKAINSITISDSIIYWTNNDSLESFYVLFRAASTLMIISLSMGLPLRGFITVGELSMSHGFYDYNQSSIKSSLIGKPIVNAYEFEKQQNWSGCIIDDKCIKLYIEAINKRKLSEKDPYGISNLLNSDLIVKYNVPLKNKKYLKKYVINWTKGGIFQHYSVSELERGFSEHNKNIERDDVKEKIKNTVDFYNKMKNE